MVGFDGGDLYREFVNRHSNVMMVLAGHVGAENHAPANRTWLPSGHPGYRVEQILTDYQFETIFGHSFDYGNGWLRTLRFSPGEGLIYANVHTVLDGDWHIFEEGASSFNRPSLADYQPPSGVTPTGSWKNPSHESHTFTHPYVPEWTVADYQENTSAFNFVDRPVVRATSTTVQPTLTKPAIARSADDFFVVVWEDDADGNGYTEVRARTFSPDGCEEHASFRVNSVSTGNQNAPQVYSHPDGRFVVIWEDERTGEFAIRARVYEPQSDGSLNAGPDVQLSDAGVTSLLPTIAGLESELVVGWVSSGTHAEVRWLSIDSLQAGAPAFTRTRSFSGSYVRFPRVSVNALGQTLLAWQAFTITGNRVHGVLLDDSGEVVDSYVHSSQSGFSSIKPPAVWLDDEGNGIAVWSERDTVLRAMLLSPSTPSTRVTTLTTSGVGVSGPSLTGLPNGDFALLWSTRVAQSTAGNLAGTWGEIRGRWYNPLQGHVPAPKGEEFKVSTLPKSAARGTPTVSEITKALGANSGVDRVDTFRHLNPAATVTEDRRLLVTWEANLYGFADPVQNKRMYRERQILVRGHKF